MPKILALALVAVGCEAISSNDYSHVYVQNWNVGWQCGSDQIPGCRDAAVDYLSTGAYGEAAIYVTVGLQKGKGADTEAVDLRLHNARFNFS